MISVLMAVFAKERPDNLRTSLQSLSTQTLQPTEIILVWDGPLPDRLSAIIDTFRGALNIRDVKLSQNRGLGAALAVGLAESASELVARMDADDIALPDRFARQYAAFTENPALDLVSGYAVEIDGNGTQGRLRTVPINHEDIISTLWANPIIHPAVMFRRDKILAVGSYNPSLRRRQDYELWFRCAAAGMRFGNIPEPLIEYRFTPDTHKRQSRKDMWQQGVIGFNGSRKIGLPLWKQLACFVPFLRSLLPAPLQHVAYRAMQRFDPRKNERSSP
ncbi:glycosyltransferase [Pelagibacterium sp.]|uniref:glycosyltransferase n=1 Tax=Pelagibacterium sp. TaxID=1967288 RepID=UPI003BAAF8CE